MIPRIVTKLETYGAPMWLVAAIAFVIIERNAKHFFDNKRDHELSLCILLLYYLWRTFSRIIWTSFQVGWTILNVR